VTDFRDGAPSAASLTDRIGIGVLTRLVPRELVDEVVAAAGRREKRKRLLPARVVVYFVMGLTLFYGDSYEEVMRKLVQGLRWLGIWRTDWTVPTSGALTQARQRLGAAVMRELFERVAVPCALRSTEGAWLNQWRLMSLDGFDIEVFDSKENAERFGYAGKKKNEKGVFPKIPVVALAECGTHAIVGAEHGAQEETETVLATRLLSSGAVTADMLVIADRGLYSHEHLQQVIDAGAQALFRVKSDVGLPALKWLPDGSYLSYSPEPRARVNASRQLKAGKIKITDLLGFYVRVVDYEITDRGDGKETFTIVTTILDPDEASALELAAAYHERWEIEVVIDEVKTHQRGPGIILRSQSPEMAEQELWGLLLTHYGVRRIMAEAADQAEIDPDRLSFIRSLRVIRRHVTSQAGFSPDTP
jgi:Insertion element 4 transposase N-terminal/Transposase DDE domain